MDKIVAEFVKNPNVREYQPRKNKNRSKARMDDREFIAWDGEGWTDHVCGDPLTCVGGCKHHYCLFGSSTGHMVRAESLSTVDCFETMLECAEDNPNAIHVAYAFSYDVNMMLRDVPVKVIRRLTKTRVAFWQGYRMEWMPKKWLQVSRAKDRNAAMFTSETGRPRSTGPKRITCRIQDIFSFFGMSFVKALRSWKVGTDVEVKSIEEGKEQRGDFQLSMLDETVVPYWKMELRLLVGLAESLRNTLYSGGFLIDKWFGPGAIASYIYKSRDQSRIMSRDLPEPVIDASCHAYAGGRFEGFRAGVHEGTIYSADINSAYPYALSLMPNMATGRWEYVRGDAEVRAALASGVRLGMSHVRYVVGKPKRTPSFPFPSFYRHPSGDMSFPSRNDVWVHVPEAKLIAKLQSDSGGFMFQSLEFVEAWVMHDDGTDPFSWVAELYNQRAEWKAQGNPAQLAAKLGLNSLYGKLAQRVGGRDGNIPPWHQLEWAGAITSTCRAMLYEASYQEHAGLIAYETDGIYSTVPLLRLPNGAGRNLGQWECEEYTGMVYLQSGVYWLRDSNGDWLPPKSRGIPTKRLDRQAALNALRTRESLKASNTQFIGFTLADMRHGRGWRTWETSTKEFVFGGNGKRAHVPGFCAACHAGAGWDETLHTLLPRPVLRDDPPSAQHSLPWRNLAPEAIQVIRRIEEGME